MKEALEKLVGPIGVSGVMFRPPGVDWKAQRVLGRDGRLVIWRAQLAAESDANLNTVESRIEAYLNDGRAYALTDGFGRSTSYAVLRRNGTRRDGRRITTTSGKVLQRWTLTFDVLWPQVGATSL